MVKTKPRQPKKKPAKNPALRSRKGAGIAMAYVKPGRTRRPKSKTIRDGMSEVHTEYFGDVLGSTTFNPTIYPINPGNADLFPWLSRLSGLYENYVFESLSFHYRAVCPSTTAGSITMAIDFDALDVAPTTKTQLRSYSGAVFGQVYGDLDYYVMPSQLHKMKQYFTNTGSSPTGSDLKTYNIGNLIIATDLAITSGSFVGELSVRFKVRLITPQLNPASGDSNSLNNNVNLQPPTQTIVQATPSLLGKQVDPLNINVMSAFTPNIDDVTFRPGDFTNNLIGGGLLPTIPTDINAIRLGQLRGYIFGAVTRITMNLGGGLINLEQNGIILKWAAYTTAGRPFLNWFNDYSYSSDGTGLITNANYEVGSDSRIAGDIWFVPYLASAGPQFNFDPATKVSWSMRIDYYRTRVNPIQFALVQTSSTTDSNLNGQQDIVPVNYINWQFASGGTLTPSNVLGDASVYSGGLPPVFTYATNAFNYPVFTTTAYLFIRYSGTGLAAPTVSVDTGSSVTLTKAVVESTTDVFALFTFAPGNGGILYLGVTATTITSCFAYVRAASPYQNVI